MRPFFHSLKYKHQLLLILTSVFLIPFILISILFLFRFQKEEQDSYVRESKEFFSQAVNTIDPVFQEIHRVSNQILIDTDLTASFNPSTVLERKAVSRKLNTYILNSSYLSEIALYSSAENLVCFSEGTSKPELYFNQIKHFESLTYEKLLSLGTNFHLLAFSDMNKNTGQAFINFLFPIHNGRFDLAVLTIEEKSLTDMGESVLLQDGDFLELYYNNKLLQRLGNASDITYDTCSGLFSDSPDGGVQFGFMDGRLLLFHQSESNLTRILLVKDPSGGNMLQKSFLLYFLILTGILLLGVAIISFFWKGAYKPIADVLSVLPESASGNEFDRVKNTLIAFSKEKQELHQNLDSSFPAIQKQYITSVIKGEFSSVDELSREGKQLGFVCGGEYFFIFAICLVSLRGDSLNSLDRLLEKICAWCNSYKMNGISSLGFVDQMNEKIIFVANTKDRDTGLLHSRLCSFHDTLYETFGLESSVGCSNIYTNTTILSNAYVEALSALDYRVVYGSGRIIYFSQISFQNYSHDWYPDALMKKFSLILKTGDEDAIQSSIDEIIDDLRKKDVPVYMAKYVCYDVMRLLADTVASESSSSEKITIGYHNIINIARVSSFEQITEILHRNITHILSLHKNPPAEENSDIKCRFIRFIDENYMHYDFSMASMVQEFSLSESTLRKLFKSTIGVTFLEYLTEKRIAKSRELLSGTQLTLKEIAFQTGYTDVSSFIRRFKQKTGMPPGEYRLLEREGRRDKKRTRT